MVFSCEVPHNAESMSEADVKLVNEELRKEIVSLKEEIAEKIKENLVITAESENQKKMISSLNNLVSDLRRENYKSKAANKVNRSGDLKQNHQKSKSRDNFLSKMKLGTTSEPVASSRKKIKVKSSNGYFQSKEFREYWSKIPMEPLDLSDLAASQNDGEEIFQIPLPKKQARCVNARKLNEMLIQSPCVSFDVSKLEDSLHNSSSVSKRKSSGSHKRDHEGFLVPLTRVKFTIVTEEKDGAGRTIPSLSYAVRPETSIRRVKMSYCKKTGLDRDKVDLKLVGNIMNLLDESSVQGLEGRVVTAVKKEQGKLL